MKSNIIGSVKIAKRQDVINNGSLPLLRRPRNISGKRYDEPPNYLKKQTPPEKTSKTFDGLYLAKYIEVKKLNTERINTHHQMSNLKQGHWIKFIPNL